MTGTPYEARTKGYESGRPDVQKLVPTAAKRILDVGCSTGALGAALKARQDAHVVGVEIDEVYAQRAAALLDRVVVADVETFAAGPPPAEAPFDCVICADVLEHLRDPWTALAALVAWLEPNGTAVISVPNVLHGRDLSRALRTQRWPRDPEGVFDATHLRWFTGKDALALLKGAGLEVVAVSPQYFSTGWKLSVKKALYRTWLGPFMPGQYVMAGTRKVEGKPGGQKPSARARPA